MAQSAPKLKTRAPYDTRIVFIWLGLKEEDSAEKSEMGTDAQESFTQMDKIGYVEDRVGVEMVDIYPVKLKDSPKEIRCWQRKSRIKEMGENDDLMCIGGRKCLTEWRTPSNDLFVRQNSVRHHLLKSLFFDIWWSPLALPVFSLICHCWIWVEEI